MGPVTQVCKNGKDENGVNAIDEGNRDKKKKGDIRSGSLLDEDFKDRSMSTYTY